MIYRHLPALLDAKRTLAAKDDLTTAERHVLAGINSVLVYVDFEALLHDAQTLSSPDADPFVNLLHLPDDYPLPLRVPTGDEGRTMSRRARLEYGVWT